MDPERELAVETNGNRGEYVERTPEGGIRGVIQEEFYIPPECIPDLNKLVIEDDTPLDNIFAEKQQRLLTEPLYSSWRGPGGGRPFLVLANVGLFYQMDTSGLAPDVMLSIDVRLGPDLSKRENRSYYIWERGKPPDVVIELVSDRTGQEETLKLDRYALIGIPYYVIFDPENRLKLGVLRAFIRSGRTFQPTSPSLFADVGLGLTLWDGPYEGHPWRWLRWCDSQGQLVPTGAEHIEQERQRAEQERQRAEQERQRAEQERQRAEQEHQRAEQEHQRAEQELQKRERAEAKLREMGIDPDV